MSRLQLLFPLIFWAFWESHPQIPVVETWFGIAIFFGSLSAIILIMRWLALRAMSATTFASMRALGRYHQLMFAARWLMLAVHAVGLVMLGWGVVVSGTMDRLGSFTATASLISSLPAVVAWIGLIWAQYPLDRAIREQNMLSMFDSGAPIYAVPTLRQHLINGIRVQVLSLLMPVGAALILRDVLVFIADRLGLNGSDPENVWPIAASAAFVMLIGPEILRRALPVSRLPDSPLRERLEAMCQRLGLRYRDILIWHTHFGIGNAAVMGLVPRFRYIMLTDLLVETMPPEQIEAVFAHEAGHVMHRHMAWYTVFVVVLCCWLSGAVSLLSDMLPMSFPIETLSGALAVIAFFFLFGALSRSFERQADVFAARNVETQSETVGVDVTTQGASAIASALEHVARMNHMPMDAGHLSRGGGWIKRKYAAIVHHASTWLHGSIRSRIEYLKSLPNNPARTASFDRSMKVIRVALLVALCSSTAWILTTYIRAD